MTETRSETTPLTDSELLNRQRQSVAWLPDDLREERSQDQHSTTERLPNLQDTTNALAPLRQIVANVHFEPSMARVITRADLDNLNFVTRKVGSKGIVAIQRAATAAITDLTELLFHSTPDYERGCTYAALRDQVTNAVLEDLIERAPESLTAADISLVEQRVAA